MQIRVFFACLLLLLPGCFGDDVEEGPDFNGKDLGKMDVYKFTLSDQNQTDFSLTGIEGQVVVLAFVYTRCDDVCLLIANNLKVVKSELTEEELEQHLSEHPFTPCKSTEQSHFGWVNALGKHGNNFVHAANGSFLLCARKEEKMLPAPVIKEMLEERCAKLEEEQGRSATKKEKEQKEEGEAR